MCSTARHVSWQCLQWVTLTPGGVGALATALRVFVSHVAEESMYQFRIVGGPHCRELGVQPGTMWTVAGVADTGADLKRLIKVRGLCARNGLKAHRRTVLTYHCCTHTSTHSCSTSSRRARLTSTYCTMGWPSRMRMRCRHWTLTVKHVCCACVVIVASICSVTNELTRARACDSGCHLLLR